MMLPDSLVGLGAALVGLGLLLAVRWAYWTWRVQRAARAIQAACATVLRLDAHRLNVRTRVSFLRPKQVTVGAFVGGERHGQAEALIQEMVNTATRLARRSR